MSQVLKCAGFSPVVFAAALPITHAAHAYPSQSSVVPPRIIQLAQPDCSDGQPCHGLHGEVVVTAEVRSDGTVGDTNPSGENQILKDAAEKAAKRSRFEPGTVNGKPKSMNYDLRFQF